MIAIVSSNARERTAFEALCENQQWPVAVCDSLHAFRRFLRHTRPAVILTRHKLADGYSDDVLGLLSAMALRGKAKSIVLLAAGVSSAQEARQVSLGADCVQRDPVRAEVLTAYLRTFQAHSSSSKAGLRPSPKAFRFAGASIDRQERTLRYQGKRVPLTPREIALIEALIDGSGSLVSYESLYAEVLQRPFRGDTSNMRVLLGRLNTSFHAVGLDLRQHVEVLPKAGYRCRENTSKGSSRSSTRTTGEAAA